MFMPSPARRHQLLRRIGVTAPVLLSAVILAACTGAAARTTGIVAAAEAAASDPPLALHTPTPEPPTSSAASPAGPAPALATLKIKLEPVIAGLNEPLFVTAAGDGSSRLFIVEKGGKIRIFQDGALAPEPLLDLSSAVSRGAEQGLLGLAFAPDFAVSGHFYVDYTDTQGNTNIVRYTVAAGKPNRADPASARTILTLQQPAANHNGGMLLFGPDGMLWIGTGDGGGSGDRYHNAQNPATLLGKMLRIDVMHSGAAPYAVPPDNPWVNADWNGQKVRPEVWAVGLRNPWRFSFDRATGDLWIGDVGQDAIEEVDRAPAGSRGGLNFGWPIMEGKRCYKSPTCAANGLTLPVMDYPHQGHCSVTGGYVYRGAAQPALNGVYFYGDYCSGTIWGLAPDGRGGWSQRELLRSGLQISSLGQDDAGEVYVTDLNKGGVYRIVGG